MKTPLTNVFEVLEDLEEETEKEFEKEQELADITQENTGE